MLGFESSQAENVKPLNLLESELVGNHPSTIFRRKKTHASRQARSQGREAMTDLIDEWQRRRTTQDAWTFLVAVAQRNNDDAGVLREAMKRLEPELVKKLLLRHAQSCTDPDCTTCCKLRNRIHAVKRKRRWTRFRLYVWCCGVIVLKCRRAAERRYAPGGLGYIETRRHYYCSIGGARYRWYLWSRFRLFAFTIGALKVKSIYAAQLRSGPSRKRRRIMTRSCST